MKFIAYPMALILCVMSVGVMLVLFGIVLPFYVAGYVAYKIPFVIREQLRLQRELREIIDGD